MNPEFRIVTHIPMIRLWYGDADRPATRSRYLNLEELAELLRKAEVQFVVANIGDQLNWVDPVERYRFWKSEVKEHLANPSQFFSEEFPGGYCYLASEWNDDPTIVLLERYH